MTATRAWIFLVALSAGSTLIALGDWAGLAAALAILSIAWAKALIILRSYLGLAAAPAWGRGFALVLGLYMLLAMALAAAAGSGAAGSGADRHQSMSGLIGTSREMGHVRPGGRGTTGG